jgi:PAP2 superfamily
MRSRAQTSNRMSRRMVLAGAAATASGSWLVHGASSSAPIATVKAAWPVTGAGDVVINWSLIAHGAIVRDNGYIDPLPASRALAMMQIAMHDAVNAVTPRYRSWTYKDRERDADARIAAAAAAHVVLSSLYPSQIDQLDAAFGQDTADAGHGKRFERSRSLGGAVARAVLNARRDDGAERRVAYVESGRNGRYRHVPGFDFVNRPGWKDLRPFALQSPSEFRVAPPPALDSEAYARALAEVRTLGGKSSSMRTKEQTEFAHFWYEHSEITWNRIGRLLARAQGLDLAETARLFALLNMALADGYIAGWDSKQHHDFWRPVTAIRQVPGEQDWTPLLTTPPVQDHPSTHSALGAAAATILAHLTGPGDTSFEVTTATALPHAPSRRFPHVRAAAIENAESRVVAGLHFRFACEAGLELGERTGREVLMRHLRAFDETTGDSRG